MGDGPTGDLPRVLRYEELLAAAARASRVPGARRARGGGALLHLGDDRQPQGRALLAPLDDAALGRGADVGVARSGLRRPDPARRADVPRQRLGAAVRGGARRIDARAAGALPHRRAAGEADRGRALHDDGVRADDLRRSAALRRRAAAGSELAAVRDLRRRGDAAGARAGVRGAPRRGDAARLGDDRDEPDVHRRARAGGARAPSRRGRSARRRAARSRSSSCAW